LGFAALVALTQMNVIIPAGDGGRSAEIKKNLRNQT